MNFVDSLGLTQDDIDAAREIAIATQADLQFPDTYGSYDIGKEGGRTIKGTGTILNPAYLGPLDDDQAKGFLDTIIHEGIHNTYDPQDWRNAEDDAKHTGYPYEEARRRTTPQLVKEFNKRRKSKARSPKKCP